MGTRDFHLKRAAHHLEVADHLAAHSEYIDWAAIAYFYAAHQMVHSTLSGDPNLSKDERHPRKHNSYGGEGTGGRGTNQLVRDVLSSIHRQYRSLAEASQRARYDFQAWGDFPMSRIRGHYEDVERYCRMLNMTRPDRGTQEP